MSTSTDLRDVIRRHAVGSQADLTVLATTAAMTIRAVKGDADFVPRARHLESLRRILSAVDVLTQFRDDGHLPEFVNDDRVPRESFEYVRWMAFAAQAPDEKKDTPKFPVLDALIENRDSVAYDVTTNEVQIADPSSADTFVDALLLLADGMLSSAITTDQSRGTGYSVA